MMLDSAFASLLALLGDPTLLGLIALATVIGMFFGVVPGMGGKLGIILLIPFVFGMDMVAGAVFLLAMHAVVHTGGSIPSILLGIPGEGPCAARDCDGALGRARPTYEERGVRATRGRPGGDG